MCAIPRSAPRQHRGSAGGCWMRADSTACTLKRHPACWITTIRSRRRYALVVYYTPSLAAAGIAAHETGHALQDAAGYLPLKARSLILPAVQSPHDCSSQECCLERILWPGPSLGAPSPGWVILFGAQTVFTLINPLVEFGASARSCSSARKLFAGEQRVEGGKWLGAAAWTYVAGAVSSWGHLSILPTLSTR